MQSSVQKVVKYLGDVDPIVARYVLVADAAGDGEPQALGPLEQLDFDQLFRWSAYPLRAGVFSALDGQHHPVACSLQRLHRHRVTHVDHRNIVHLE